MEKIHRHNSSVPGRTSLRELAATLSYVPGPRIEHLSSYSAKAPAFREDRSVELVCRGCVRLPQRRFPVADLFCAYTDRVGWAVHGQCGYGPMSSLPEAVASQFLRCCPPSGAVFAMRLSPVTQPVFRL